MSELLPLVFARHNHTPSIHDVPPNYVDIQHFELLAFIVLESRSAAEVPNWASCIHTVFTSKICGT